MSELTKIPGVGASIAKDFEGMGYETISSLKGQSPQEMYNLHCSLQGCYVDRCFLYVCRCAVYFAENEIHEPEKLKWEYWKDDKNYRLTDLPNIGGVLEKRLFKVGVFNAEMLFNIGSKDAFAKLFIFEGDTCFNTLCALDGAIKGIRWHNLSETEKSELKQSFEIIITKSSN